MGKKVSVKKKKKNQIYINIIVTIEDASFDDCDEVFEWAIFFIIRG